MAKKTTVSDWAPGTTFRPTVVNITFDDDGQVTHVGVGYHVYLPSGAVAATKGHTWDTPPDHGATLQQAMHALLEDVRKAEGFSGLAATQHGTSAVIPPAIPIPPS
jgi:hypothetical protein